MSTQQIAIVSNIKLPINASVEEAFSVAAKRLRRAGLNPEGFYVYKRSIDARHKNDICFVYSIAAKGDFSHFSATDGISLLSTAELQIERGKKEMSSHPVIVGCGPAGLFAGLLLAEEGYAPIIIERGGSISERKTAVERFKTFKVLDTESNIQFGAGGAGTFSDGKLVTRINDSLTDYILDRFTEFGAPENIKYIAKPHVGTDILSGIVESIIARIEELGGRVLYHTKLLSIGFTGNSVSHIVTNKGNIEASALILAIGHSARDTYEYLMKTGLAIECKPFSVGMRIEHLADDIDKAMYGDLAGHELLGHAEYNFSYDTKNRGTYTFCMCPGGEVVPAASENDTVVVNGMSYNARNGKNSNSAVVCSVFKDDYGATPEGAIEFQRKIERAAYSAAGSDYSAPIITVGDFLNGGCSHEPTSVIPTYMNSTSVRLARPETYLPSFVTEQIKKALLSFDRKAQGFASRSAVLTGAETRTSAPLRILRDNETRLALGYDNLYPVGEGAGYAGGITSAAIDGLRSALSLMKIYKPFS